MGPPGRTTRRSPKGNKRARTRAALLAAARSLIQEKNHEQPTLEEIAQRAGMTTGAIYGNFRNRDELFMAIGDAAWAPIKPRLKPHASFPDVLRAMADAALAAVPQRGPAAVGHLTGVVYALRHPDARTKVSDATARSYAMGVEWLRSMIDEDQLPMPADQLVRVIHAMTEGLVLQRILTPDLVPDEVFYAAFEALASAASPRAPQRSQQPLE